jgi:hypothetical protein
MASIQRQYTDEIFEQFGYWGTWTPDVPVAIGDVGRFDDHILVPSGTLGDYGISFDVDLDTQKGDQKYQSKDGVDITVKAAADATQVPNVPEGKAALSVKFSREAACVFAFKGGLQNRMASQNEVLRLVIGKAQSNDFPDDLAIVTHVYDCESLSVVVSQSRDAELTVTADADFKAGIIDLASASLGLSVASSRNLAAQTVASEGGTPLFRVVRLKRNLWQDVGLRSAAAESDVREPGDVFEVLTPQNADGE